MFTGIIRDVGEVTAREDGKISIRTQLDLTATPMGASICCGGICLTVVKMEGKVFTVDVSPETFSKTTAERWQPFTRINLEPSLKAGDELGGHIVTGHVDGVGQVKDRVPDGNSVRYFFTCPRDLMPFIAPKGSIAVNGVSLTVNGVDSDGFDVAIIPHTLKITTFQDLQPGMPVNLEIDPLARYAARAMEAMQCKMS